MPYECTVGQMVEIREWNLSSDTSSVSNASFNKGYHIRHDLAFFGCIRICLLEVLKLIVGKSAWRE